MSSVEEYSTEDTLTGDEKIIARAKRRYHYCEQWESNFRKLFLDDVKFANADSDNHYQWPNNIRQTRDIEQRPCLTINRTQVHNLQIINDAKQNKATVKIIPVGDGATKESADVFEGVIRHIEYISNATVAYDTALKFQVEGGIGYWRLATDYVGGDSFDQEIYIRRIKDPLSVYLDPDIQELDGSDARFGFIFDDMSRDEFKEAYPQYKDKMSDAALGNSSDWFNDDHVRVAEYFEAVPVKHKLFTFTDPSTGETRIVKEKDIKGGEKELLKQVIDDPATRWRWAEETRIDHYLIIGETIAEKTVWPGKYVPIIRIIGTETTIDGHMDRKGHTRCMKDPQRMLNYMASSSVEFAALQTKSPFIAPAAAIEGLETYWETCNTINYSVLPYNHIDDDGNLLQPPMRPTPPGPSPLYIQGIQAAQEQMVMVSGQEPANFGAPSNEQSGRAINERQRSGERSTYHFNDNFSIGLRFTGKQLLDLIPKIYDTPRVLRILAEDGTGSHVMLDPNMQQAHAQMQQMHQQEVVNIFNPNVGKYDVMADVGPGYATRRQEAFNAFTQIISQNQELMPLVGDLMFKNADFPGADDIAERLERMVPAQAKGEGPPPELQQAQQQIQQAQQVNTKLLQTLTEERLKLKGKEQQKEIDVYKAVTDRLNVIEKHIMTPRLQAELLQGFALQEHSSNNALLSASASAEQQTDNQL